MYIEQKVDADGLLVLVKSRRCHERAKISEYRIIGPEFVPEITISRVDVCGGKLIGEDLRKVTFDSCKFTGVCFYECNLAVAQFRYCKLVRCIMVDSDFQSAHFDTTLLREVDFSRCDLAYTVFAQCGMPQCDFSQARGIYKASDWMANNFRHDDEGYLVYKRIGLGTPYSKERKATNWQLEPGAVLEENVLYDRSTGCGCGINFATKDFLKTNSYYPSDVWLCRILWRDLPDVVVPYNTFGKARCARLTLLKQIDLYEGIITDECPY